MFSNYCFDYYCACWAHGNEATNAQDGVKTNGTVAIYLVTLTTPIHVMYNCGF